MAGKYETEKLLGLRQPDGSLKLKRLKQKHLRIIALHLCGTPYTEIAKMLNYSYSMVVHTIRDPLARQLIQEHQETTLMELQALIPEAVDAVREGLRSEDEKVRLVAVDKLRGLLGDMEVRQKPEENEDAEQLILEVRAKFVKMIKEAIPTPLMVEGEFVAEDEENCVL